MAQYVQLRAVQAVAEHGGFSRAAVSLGLTQPAISDQVRRLEKDYGVVLFERRGRVVTPTTIGRQLLSVIQQIFDAKKDAEALLTQAGSLETGALSIVSDAPDLAVTLIAAFRTAHPAIVISLSIASAEACLGGVLAGRADVAVTAAAPVDARLHGEELRREKLMALVPKHHPLAARTAGVRLRTLVEAGLIFRGPHSTTQRLLAAELERHGLTAMPALLVDGREAMVEAVAAGLGIGVIAANEFGGRRGVRAIRIRDCLATVAEYLVTLTSHRGSRLIDGLYRVARADAGTREAASAG